jgi:hypothetical protein
MTTSLVYGESFHGYLTIVPEGAIEKATAEVERVLAAKTYGQARAIDAPGADDDFADDEPYDVQELGIVQDGDWPPNAGMLGLQMLPQEVCDIVAIERSMVGQEWIEFSEADEDRVVGELSQRGYQVRRDDELIKRFDLILEE